MTADTFGQLCKVGISFGGGRLGGRRLWKSTFPEAYAGVLVMRDVANRAQHAALERQKAALEAQLRTQITAGTRNVVYTVYAPTGIDAQTVQRHLQTIQQNVMLIAPEARVELSLVRGATLG